MPHDRYFFACDASPTEGLVYIAGGYHRRTYSPYLEGFVYNVDGNKWDFFPPMNSDYVADADLCAGVFLDDKFYAVPCESQRAQVYDPHTRLWNNINTDSNADYTHSCVAALEGFGLTWNNCARSWIYVKEIDIVSNSETRAGRFAAATSRGYFFVSVVECINRVEYYTFNSRAREER
ncbi:hypothetical protein SUGI_0244560 [Cryptomeria japonica]|nr:hypothetical protein SUGI_0244560 [Cryptomeria japonica]